MKNSIFFISLVFFVLQVSAQHWCGFDKVDRLRDDTDHAGYEEELKKYLAKQPLKRGEEEVLTIPVVVHVLHTNSIDEVGVEDNISDEQIFSAIQVLNDHFRRTHPDTNNTPARFRSVAADININFCLATLNPEGFITNGITRHRTNKRAYSISDADERLVKSYGYWPSDQYLNVWVTRLTGDILGYGYFPDGTSIPGLVDVNAPDLDGVVISPLVFGNNIGLATGFGNPYKFGRTFVHEVGHWLGLRHTFNSTGSSCNYTDYCDDTPKQVFPTEDLQDLEDCSQEIIGRCGEIIMHQNYMDYTIDVCLNLFTQDQKERMRSAMELSPRRNALKFSQGCCGTSLKTLVPSKVDFSDEDFLLQNWELMIPENSSSSWDLFGEQLVANTNLIVDDSLIIASGSMNYFASEDLVLRLDVSANAVDSIKFYYERSCSGDFILFHKELIDESEKDIQLSLKGLAEDGIMRFYSVVYSNGNEVYIDDLQIYKNDEFEVTVFPNPTTGEIIINLKLQNDNNVQYSLYDYQGKRIIASSFGVVNSGEYGLNLSNLVPGMYLLNVTSGESSSVKKIFLE